MAYTFSNAATVSGYNCGEVASAMQKCIRRGLEMDALFWASELDLSGYGEYVWKRLKIIASEDVGLADDSAAVAVSCLYQSWREQRSKKDSKHAPERLFLVHAVIILVRAKKSRLVDHALIAMYEAPRPHPPIPDYALERHTIAGKRLRRGEQGFAANRLRVGDLLDLPQGFLAGGTLGHGLNCNGHDHFQDGFQSE